MFPWVENNSLLPEGDDHARHDRQKLIWRSCGVGAEWRGYAVWLFSEESVPGKCWRILPGEDETLLPVELLFFCWWGNLSRIFQGFGYPAGVTTRSPALRMVGLVENDRARGREQINAKSPGFKPFDLFKGVCSEGC